jgi:K+/H+ antiporter YhaU regulatory subunit KhtT
MIGDFGTVNAKDFRIAVEVIEMLIGDYAIYCANYTQKDSLKESKRLIEDEVNALAKKLRKGVESEKFEQAKRLKVVIPTEIAPEAQLEKLMDELEAALGAIQVTPNVETAFRNLEQVVRKLYT